MKKNKIDENINFDLTLQQKFNFESKKIEDENIERKKLYKKRSEIIKLKKKILELEKQKGKLKTIIFILLFFVIVITCICTLLTYKYANFEPKIVNKTIIKGEENIVFLGDSITERYNLEEYYGKKINVVNSGVGGNTTDDIISNMTKRLYQYNPTKVFLLVGINNIIQGQDTDDIYSDIVKIINEIKQKRKNINIYVESIYPTNETNDEKIFGEYVNSGFNEKIKIINYKLKRYCKKNNITYIDVYSKLIDSNEQLNISFTLDGIHLNQKGYEVVTNTLSSYIKK